MMTIENDIMQVMSQVFVVPLEKITPDASVQTMAKWDSLRHMQLMVALEHKFEIQLTDEEVVALKSFAQIRDAIAKHLQ